MPVVIYRSEANELDSRLVESIRAMFKDGQVVITVELDKDLGRQNQDTADK